MIVTRIEGIGAVNLSASYKTANGVGFCYFDPEDELLKEFTESVVIPVFPGEETTRQFYIVKDDPNLIMSTLALKITTDSSSYIVKTSLDFKEDFSKVQQENSLLIFLSQYPTGIVPVTVYIKNVKDTRIDFNLNIELEVS